MQPHGVLTYCPQCGKEVYPASNGCKHCGYPDHEYEEDDDKLENILTPKTPIQAQAAFLEDLKALLKKHNVHLDEDKIFAVYSFISWDNLNLSMKEVYDYLNQEEK